MAKTKLPKDIKKKIEEWKFTSRVLVMCLVAYHDGKDVQALVFGSPVTRPQKDRNRTTVRSFSGYGLSILRMKDRKIT
jgi:hypothetical protein